MKATIIHTPDIVEMARECATRVAHFTNLRPELVEADSRFTAHRLKLEVFQWQSEPVWLVDADLWFIAPCVLPVPAGPVIYGNPDNSIINRERYAGTRVEVGHAFNTSLIGLDPTCREVREALEDASAMQAERYGPEPVEDERFFNIAFSRPGLTLCRLSTRFNWCGTEPPASTVAVHAASRRDKMTWLREVVGFCPSAGTERQWCAMVRGQATRASRSSGLRAAAAQRTNPTHRARKSGERHKLENPRGKTLEAIYRRCLQWLCSAGLITNHAM